MSEYSDVIVDEALESKVSYNNGGVLKFERRFTTYDVDPLDTVNYTRATSEIIDRKTGQPIFRIENLEAPDFWSGNARAIVGEKYLKRAGVPGNGHEDSVRTLVYRVGHTIRLHGEQHGYFASKDEADIFEAELKDLLIKQKAAFNSPVWFNCGLWHVHGIKDNTPGMYAWDFKEGKVVEVDNTYKRPQCSACFINQVDDSLLGHGSIHDGIETEARLFKYGSGVGSNWSRLRAIGEPLSGGGTSSGLMSFLKILDANAQATKSGGVTRRAAKMVVVDSDHPEIEDFIKWKWEGEKIVAALATTGYYSTDFEDVAYKTAPGQNSNNSVMVKDEFMKAVEEDRNWLLIDRLSGRVRKEVKARDLWDLICKAAWASGDPGLQFYDTMNLWNPVINSGEIEATNPCAEYIFLNNSACNLASLNILKFCDEKGKLDTEAFKHGTRTMITAQEILVDLSSYPRKEIAQNSHDFRPLGLGYTNLGAWLMINGIPYDSEEGRVMAGAITAILTGTTYDQSARIASRVGPFSKYDFNREPFLKVMKQHRDAARKIERKPGLELLVETAERSWDEAIEIGERYGYRNAQTTNIAPTGTISFFMDADTFGLEPDFALVKYKKLAGGGELRIPNMSIAIALRNLKYGEKEISDIEKYVAGHGNLQDGVVTELKKFGLTDGQISEANKVIDKNKMITANTPYVSPGELYKRGLPAEIVSRIIKHVNGHATVEGAPHLKPDHYDIFDCAVPGGKGVRSISPMGHVLMAVAIQPFVSGGMSKTVNLPEEATIEDISDIYMAAWKLGLKDISVYRDGSKLSQPLNVTRDTRLEERLKLGWGDKKRLPSIREGITISAKVGELGQKIHLRTGEYEDGSIGEIFVTMFKEGAEYRAALDSFAISTSDALQHGSFLERIVRKYLGVRIDPQGLVQGHPYIKTCSSVFDFIVKAIGVEYLGIDKFEELFGQNLIQGDVDPSKLRKNIVERRNLARRYIRIVEGRNVEEEGRREKKTNQGRKAELVVAVPKIKKTDSGAGILCRNCGGEVTRTGVCNTCLNCGATDGCG